MSRRVSATRASQGLLLSRVKAEVSATLVLVAHRNRVKQIMQRQAGSVLRFDEDEVCWPDPAADGAGDPDVVRCERLGLDEVLPHDHPWLKPALLVRQVARGVGFAS